MKSTWPLAASLALLACHNNSTAPEPLSSAPSIATIESPHTVEPTAQASAPRAFDCGAKDQPPCPMQRWMKSVMSKASTSGDLDRLAQALDYVADHPPPGMPQWQPIAQTAATQARAQDIRQAKQACQHCHDLYKKPYQAQMRDRPF